MPLQATSGAASYDAFGGGVAAVPQYIEDVFSTYLYTGNGSTQTITNNIDLSTYGGMVWGKDRGAGSHRIYDTVRGGNKSLKVNSTEPEDTWTSPYIMTFNNNGYESGLLNNESSHTYASWTFRKQPKFFDVVTWTGDGSTTRELPHSLASLPGFIIIKRTNGNGGWETFARDNSNNFNRLFLNTTGSVFWVTAQTNIASSTNLNVGYLQANLGSLNVSGETYVAYLFAHNAGGFGLTGTDNVISCGSYTGNGSATGPVITLGYEPQWVMVKRATVSTGSWEMYDSMRGFTMTNDAVLRADTSGSEFSLQRINPTSTGFQLADSDGDVNANGSTYIYIAIRRGPMKVPTSGTSVFSPVAYTGNGSTRTYSVGFPTDLSINMNRNVAGDSPTWNDRLRGSGFDLYSNSTGSEQNNGSAGVQFDNQTNIVVPSYRITNGTPYIDWCMRRAPSFFDEVCYTGTGVNRTVAHNLTVAPELVIIKSRSNAVDWVVGNTSLGFANFLMLNRNDASGSTSSIFNNTAPTASVFSVGASSGTNEVTLTYVAYLFATCAGVSKVGTFTGNGSSQTINCGFTGGARFVMIKATSTTGDWMVADSARGIVSGSDPYLELNNTNAEVTGEDWLDTDSTGFVVNQVSASNANTNGVTYIYLAIA